MNEYIVYGNTAPEAYHNALYKLWDFGCVNYCKDWDCLQKECGMTICVKEPLSEPRISRLMIGDPLSLEQYRQEMLYGILDFEVDRGNWHYTYHRRMSSYRGLDQIQFVIDELKRNPTSRRAVITVRDPIEDAPSENPACLQMIQYFIRDEKLDCVALFRSNDACNATFMNAFALIELQSMIASQLQVAVGTYTHRANSFHCYEKDFDKLDGYVTRIAMSKSISDLTYDFAGDWDAQMDEARDEIVEKVGWLYERSVE